MKNEMSEIGYSEDLIRAYIQFGCAEIHAKTLYEKATAELENGIAVPDEKQLQKLEQYRIDIGQYADLRRRMMRKLFEMFDGDKDMWCQAKHLGIGAMCLFEAYEGSDDEELLMMAYEANREFISAMSRFLGTEWTDCASCFSDYLKGITHE